MMFGYPPPPPFLHIPMFRSWSIRFSAHLDIFKMLVSELVAKHLLILCCYGGSPFVDIQLPGDSKIKHKSTYALDPTDWIAVDTAGVFIIKRFHLYFIMVLCHIRREHCEEGKGTAKETGLSLITSFFFSEILSQLRDYFVVSFFNICCRNEILYFISILYLGFTINPSFSLSNKSHFQNFANTSIHKDTLRRSTQSLNEITMCLLSLIQFFYHCDNALVYIYLAKIIKLWLRIW